MTDSLKDMLGKGGCTLAVSSPEVSLYYGSGVADLLDLVTSGKGILRGASVADKVVGKGAASLMVAGGVAEAHARLISESGRETLTANGVALTFDDMVPHILNRRKDGICPIERLCDGASTPEECVSLIAQFINEKRNSK